MSDSNMLLSQNNPFSKLNNIKSSPEIVPSQSPSYHSNPRETPNLRYSSSDQRNGPKIDNIFQNLNKFFKSYQTLISNYEFIISTNNDYYSKFLNNLENNDIGLDVGSLEKEIYNDSHEGDLYRQDRGSLINTILRKNDILRKFNIHFNQLNHLLSSARGKLEEQKQTQVDLNRKAQTIVRAFHKKDPHLLEQLNTIVPVASKPKPDLKVKSENKLEPVPQSNIYSSDTGLNVGSLEQDAQNEALKRSFDLRSRAIGSEQNSLGSHPMMASSSSSIQNYNNSGPLNSPFLNPSDVLGSSNASNPLLTLSNSSGQNMSVNQNIFRDLESVEMISVGKEKGLILSSQPISGSGDYLRYPVLFEQDKQIILKYINNNSLKRAHYSSVSSNLRGKINFISKSQIMADFISLKNQAQDIWEQNESNRTAALSMISDIPTKEAITQYGVFKLRKNMSQLSPSTQDIYFIRDIPHGFENNNLIKFSFPNNVERGLHSVEVYVIQLATSNPQNVQFFHESPNDIIRDLMRQWVIFIQKLHEKKNQLKEIYDREFEDIKGINSKAIKRGIRGQIKNIGIRMIGEETAQKHGLTRDTNNIPSEPEYRFFESMLQLSLELVSDMKRLIQSYNRFDLHQDQSERFNLTPNPSSLDYVPLGGGSYHLRSKKKNKFKKKNKHLRVNLVKSHKNPKRN